jgi:restriction endonuclease Mrr
MSIPTVEDCFMPVLKALGSEEPIIEQVALQRAKRDGFEGLPSIYLIQTDKRGVPLIQRRIAWARFYLGAAGFIQHRSRNLIQLTPTGAEAHTKGRCSWADLTSTSAWRQKFGEGWMPPQAQS